MEEEGREIGFRGSDHRGPGKEFECIIMVMGASWGAAQQKGGLFKVLLCEVPFLFIEPASWRVAD